MKTLLFNPFAKYSEKKLLATGILLTVLGSYLAYIMNGRYDGVLDLHFVHEVLIWQPFVDNGINILCLFFFLVIATKYMNAKTRLIDIMAAVLIARVPLYLLPLLNFKNRILLVQEELMASLYPGQIPEFSVATIISLLIFTVFAILFLVWYMLLLFRGYKVASNAKGSLPVLFFALCIVLAEISSILLIPKLTS